MARSGICLSVATALIVAACLAPGPVPDGSARPPSPSSSAPASAAPSPFASAALGSSLPSSAPQPGDLDRWGPLAVVPPQEGADAARTEGRLRITDVCVLLEGRGGVSLLVWSANWTAWNPERRTITFSNIDGTIATIEDGDSVVLGGSGGSLAEDGVSAAQWLARTTWESPPAGDCVLDQHWYVGAVEIE